MTLGTKEATRLIDFENNFFKNKNWKEKWNLKFENLFSNFLMFQLFRSSMQGGGWWSVGDFYLPCP